jgi:WS/DGAT/MGAT family acyltransferase
MSATRVSALDASFLTAETPTAHMHVGWAAVFSPPDDGPRPSFGELREHVGARLGRAPRYRQKLARVPLDVHDPVWVDDDHFDLDHHVLHAEGAQLRDVVDLAMSAPLERSRPLWELWITERLSDGRIGIVGKAHHCMVDGLAAVELATLLLDPTPEPGPDPQDGWRPQPAPGWTSLLARGLLERARRALPCAALAPSFGRWTTCGASSPTTAPRSTTSCSPSPRAAYAAFSSGAVSPRCG